MVGKLRDLKQIFSCLKVVCFANSGGQCRLEGAV